MSGCALSRSAWSKRGRSRKSERSATGSGRNRSRSTGKGGSLGIWQCIGGEGDTGSIVRTDRSLSTWLWASQLRAFYPLMVLYVKSEI